eukprot:5101244-Amphidinium_carterae.1
MATHLHWKRRKDIDAGDLKRTLLLVKRKIDTCRDDFALVRLHLTMLQKVIEFVECNLNVM